MATALRILHGEPAPGVVEMEIHGDVDLGSGKRLEREIDEVLEAGGRLVVNLFGCTFLDSSGLSALIRTSRATSPATHVAVLCPPEGTVRQVFALTRAHTFLDLHSDRDAALAAVAA